VSDRDQTRLAKLLDKRNEHPEQLQAIDAEIRRRFERTVAILVLDMSGFSRLTLRHGIIHFLSLIRRMHRTVVPIVKRGRGSLVKTEADNLFATFADVPRAIATAREVHERLEQDNRVLPADWDVHVGIGIGYGPTLVLGHDMYGSEMNLASKLGEDLARPGDVLLTEAAFVRAGRYRRTLAPRQTRTGGVRLRYHELAVRRR